MWHEYYDDDGDYWVAGMMMKINVLSGTMVIKMEGSEGTN